VHVAGVQAFLDMARSLGHETIFLGPAVTISRLLAAVKEHQPDAVAVSYRLGVEGAGPLLSELKAARPSKELKGLRMYFGGTPPVAQIAAKTGMFDAVFDGSESPDKVLSILRGASAGGPDERPAQTLVARITQSAPVPLIRHHFGLPSLEQTVAGAKKIAESGIVDILSIAPDQNAQENLFAPADLAKGPSGTGGAPIRTREHLATIYEATRTGGYPLLRCYSGTRDLIKWAEMLKDTINNAWCAVPLTWYSELDGRSKRPLREAVQENQAAIKWHAERGVPVEVTESHQWALRRSGDAIEAATAYIAAYNARAFGVKEYVCQFMFDTPKGVSPAMDLAKMLAKLELVESLNGGGSFSVIRMVRSGIASFSPNPRVAKGQLAASVFNSMALRPHIVHVVGYCEGDHAATADELIESCEIARGAISTALRGMPSYSDDRKIQARKAQVLTESRFLVESIKRLKRGKQEDPLTSAEVLVEAVTEGLLDAPDLAGSRVARGKISTAIVNGSCVVVDPGTCRPVSESDRVRELAVSEDDLDLAEDMR
jgi:hypothetical protein